MAQDRQKWRKTIPEAKVHKKKTLYLCAWYARLGSKYMLLTAIFDKFITLVSCNLEQRWFYVVSVSRLLVLYQRFIWWERTWQEPSMFSWTCFEPGVCHRIQALHVTCIMWAQQWRIMSSFALCRYTQGEKEIKTPSQRPQQLENVIFSSF